MPVYTKGEILNGATDALESKSVTTPIQTASYPQADYVIITALEDDEM